MWMFPVVTECYPEPRSLVQIAGHRPHAAVPPVVSADRVSIRVSHASGVRTVRIAGPRRDRVCLGVSCVVADASEGGSGLCLVGALGSA